MHKGSSPPDERSIQLMGVTKTFHSRGENIAALNGVNLRIETGQFVSVVGPSGCGKSTLLKVVAGLLEPTSGTIEIGETEIHGPFTDVGIVFQRDLLLESRTALENVLLQVEMRGLGKKKYEGQAKELLKTVGLMDFEHKYPRELSGGMRQRVAICRALIHDPPILLMDEPFGALDALTRDEIALDLTWLCERSGKTVLFITHSISEAIFLSDRVVVMTTRPARIEKDIQIDLPRPRSIEEKNSRRFAAYMAEIGEILFDKSRMRRRH